MKSADKNRDSTFGFLKVIDLEGIGFCGGLLVVSKNGRPIEFHCTTPVVKNRAQEIMYGATYLSYLFNDQIGISLVDKCRSNPDLYLIDDPDCLPITELIDQPVFLLERGESASFDARGLKSFATEDFQLHGSNLGSTELGDCQKLIDVFCRSIPLDEPMERIQLAIEEANQVRRAG